MSAGRVLATQQAREAAKQLLALTGSVKEQVGRVLQQGGILADPHRWDGGLAGKWRNDWGTDASQLNQCTAKLDELERRAHEVVEDIFKADSGPGSGPVHAAAQEPVKALPPQAKKKDHGLLGDIGGFFGGVLGGGWNILKHFGEGVADGAVGFVTGLGGLIGRDPSTGKWSWSAAGAAWEGLGKFGLALEAYSGIIPGGALLDQTVGVPGLGRGELGNTLLNAGKGLIAYDEWGKDPARAAGTTAFNVVAAVVGTKGAGAGLRAAGDAVDASSVAGTAARLSEISETLKEAGLKSDYIDKIPPEQLSQVQQALDEWGTDASGRNQGVTHIVDYAEGAGGAGKANRLAKLTEYTGGGPFNPADPLLIPKVDEALDASVNAAKSNAADQVRLQGDKALYFVPKDGVTPGPNGFSNSQKGLIIIKYKGKYAAFMNGTYKKFTGM